MEPYSLKYLSELLIPLYFHIWRIQNLSVWRSYSCLLVHFQAWYLNAQFPFHVDKLKHLRASLVHIFLLLLPYRYYLVIYRVKWSQKGHVLQNTPSWCKFTCNFSLQLLSLWNIHHLYILRTILYLGALLNYSLSVSHFL